jgi:hypothetical protein
LCLGAAQTIEKHLLRARFRRKQIVAVMAAIATLRGRLPATLPPRKGTGVTAIILNSLAPVFFGMALGYLAGWTRDVDNTHVAELNALVMDFAVPASMFVTVVRASRRTLLDELPLAANLSISMLILYLVLHGPPCVRRRPR